MKLEKKKKKKKKRRRKGGGEEREEEGEMHHEIKQSAQFLFSFVRNKRWRRRRTRRRRRWRRRRRGRRREKTQVKSPFVKSVNKHTKTSFPVELIQATQPPPLHRYSFNYYQNTT